MPFIPLRDNSMACGEQLISMDLVKVSPPYQKKSFAFLSLQYKARLAYPVTMTGLCLDSSQTPWGGLWPIHIGLGLKDPCVAEELAMDWSKAQELLQIMTALYIRQGLGRSTKKAF